MRTPHHIRVAARRGLTLLELLMVMTIVGIVFGLGLGAVSTMDPGRGADTDLVRGALRSARASAVAERHPAALEVLIDPETQRPSLRVRRMRTLGTWHFERPDGRGTSGLNAEPIKGARQVDDGYLGRALGLFGRARDARAEIALHTLSRFDVRDGFSFDLFVRREGDAGGTILRLGRNEPICGLEATDRGGLLAWVAPLYEDSSGREVPGGREDLRLPEGSVVAGRWTRLTFMYDGAHLRLLVDGFLAGAVACRGPLHRLEEPLVLGGEPAPFPGTLDNLVMRGVDVSDPLPLSESAVWPEDVPRVIQFDADGSLDPLVHPGGAFEIVLASEPDEPVTIGRLGVVQ